MISTAAHTCVYIGCTNSRKTHPNLSFFRIPVQDNSRCDQWLINSGNWDLLSINRDLLVNKVLCEEHFTAQDFRDCGNQAKRKLLLWNAVPVQHDPNMPKMSPKPSVETRNVTKRAASKEATTKLQLITKSELPDSDEPETLEILSDDEVIPVEPPKKKYRVCQSKSSDDRDILVVKTLAGGEATLALDSWQEELSPIQLAARNKMQKEYSEMSEKIEKLLSTAGAEIIFQGDSFTAFEIEGSPTCVASGQQTTATPTVTPTTSKSIPSSNTTKSNGPSITTVPSTALVSAPTNQSSSSAYSFVVDPRSGQVVGTVTPAAQNQIRPGTRKRGRASTNSPVPVPPAKVAKIISNNPAISIRPTESNSVGGIQPTTSAKSGASSTKTQPVAAVVDLTSDDGKPSADSKEVSFNKLQGKTFPSLVVVARPSLHVSPNAQAERGKLDMKVKSVLMHAPTKFTEWLIQQGLIKADQNCTLHTSNKLKLGMYSDVTKFPFSGGYVWISECCPQRFVSVFSGSIFEGSPHPPSVILKLVYHWACQTNVQNVIQWVKVENLYVKGLNTWLRAACTVALHTHIHQLGGPGVRVEIGVISLGTTSQDGNQRQVKVEVLGILETHSKKIRLRAVEPFSEGDRNYKKRFSKILEPLSPWVHPESIIVTDLTVDRNTLFTMGFMNVQQVSTSGGNQSIMDYLRRIVPRMFQNTLSLLSRQIIQQFLDELVWREWFGSSAADAFDNLILHLSEQTRSDMGQSLITRLNKVATNPFKTWSIEQQLQAQPTVSQPSINKTLAEPPQKRQRRKQQITKAASPTPELLKPVKPLSPDVPELMVPIEHYYYGTIDGVNTAENLKLNVKCHVCKEQFSNNIALMKHYFKHAHANATTYQCPYCLAGLITKDDLDAHILRSHPLETKIGNEYFCIICEANYNTTYMLGKHMSTEHLPSELPYQCGTCYFRCSSHKEAIDHFHTAHSGQGIVQCPFCLKSMIIASPSRIMPQNLHYFLHHLQKHQRKTLAKKCPKCSLWFIQKDGVRDHLKMHETQRKKAGLRPWEVPRNGVTVPKSVRDYVEEEEIDISSIIVGVADDSVCKECDKKMTTPDHYPSVLTCSNENCQYITCCKKAMEVHEEDCKNFKANIPQMKLPFEMFCVCGYSDTDGNSMANHLAFCERHSAYPSMEVAKAATVTHSMLDVLGLVRRPEEPTPAVEPVEVLSDTEMAKETDKNDKEESVEKEKTNDKESMEVVELDDDDKEEEATEIIDNENEKEVAEKDVEEEKDIIGEKDVESEKDTLDDKDALDENDTTREEHKVDDKVTEKETVEEKESTDEEKEVEEVKDDRDSVTPVEPEAMEVDESENENSNRGEDTEDKTMDSEDQNETAEEGSPANTENSDTNETDNDKIGNTQETGTLKETNIESELSSHLNNTVPEVTNADLPADILNEENLEQIISEAQNKMLNEELTQNNDVDGLLKDIMEAECPKTNDISDVMMKN